MSWRHLRSFLSVVIVSFSSACSPYLFQEPDVVLVGRGNEERQGDKAKDYAAYFLPYALLADMAYQSLDQPPREGCGKNGADACASLLTAIKNGTGNESILVKSIKEDAYTFPTTKDEPPPSIDAMRRANSVLKEWRLLGVYQISDKTPIEEICGWRYNPPTQWCHPFRGLEVQAWGSTGGKHPQLVIAFRGSDPEQGDWLTNLRWVTRFIPASYDQYDQVRDNIDTWINESVDAYAATFRDPSVKGCAAKPPNNCPLEMVATGHSLGGGLAQQAAYASSGRIRRAITFDPSPVTGFYSVDKTERDTAKVGLVIDRVYEHGEFLAYVRLFMREVYPVSESDPTVYQLRFNKAKGNIFAQHSLNTLIAGYIVLADTQDGPTQPSRPDWIKAK